MGRKNKNLIFIPIFKSYEVKNPKTLFSVDWVDKYGEDRVRVDEVPEFDKDGNYLGTKTDVYVTMIEVVKWRIIKRKHPLKEEARYKPGQLFEIKNNNEEDNLEDTKKRV